MTCIFTTIAIAAIIIIHASIRYRHRKEQDNYDEFLRSLMARSERDNPPRARTIISNEHGETEL